MKNLLQEIVLHFSYDAEVNGSKFTEHPFGRIALATTNDALWQRIINQLSRKTESVEYEILQDIANTLQLSVTKEDEASFPVGIIKIEKTDGSLWKRILDFLGYEPDMIRDVVAPLIKKKMTEQDNT